MVCCRQEIECMLEVHREKDRAVAIALWFCNRCSTTFWQPLGEISSERAQPIIIAPRDPSQTDTELQERRKRTFTVVKGGKGHG
jgi:hypothetical protein